MTAKKGHFPVAPGDKSLSRLQNSRTRPTEHGTMLKKRLLPLLLPHLSMASGHILARKNQPYRQQFGAPFPDMGYFTYRQEMGEHLERMHRTGQ
jgi:hypothetical protein